MASIADLISNLKKKLTDGYNQAADALPIVPNTKQIQSFTSNPVQFMTNPSYNGGNNLYRTTPFKIGASIQNAIESPKSTADMIPRFQAPQNASLLRKASTFAYNIPIELGANVIGRGIVDPILDMSQNIGRTIGGRQLAGYEQVKSPITRTGYQIAGQIPNLKPPTDTKYNLKEVAGNIGGIANPIIDASTGSLAKNLATNIIKSGGKETAKILLKRGLLEGGLMGGASGLSLGLSENRKTSNNLDYAKNTLTSLATGAAAGATIGGVSAGAGILFNKLLRNVREVKQKATEQEVIKQLVAYLPDLKLNTQFLMSEFDVEIKRLEHMKSSVIGSGPSNYEITPHNTITPIPVRNTETTDNMLREYLLHIFQYGTPEERIKIIGGINSRFQLSQRRLLIL